MVAAISFATRATGILTQPLAFLISVKETIQKNSSSWSFKLLCTSASLTGITAIASAILSQFVIATIASAFTATSLLGAYQINNLRVTKNLQGYVDELSKKVQSLQSLLDVFQKENKKLDLASKELESKSLQYKKTIEAESTKLQERMKEMDLLLAKSKENEKTWASTKENHEAQVKKLENENEKLQKSIKLLTTQNNALAEQTRKIKEVQKELQTYIAAQQAAGQKFDQENSELVDGLAKAHKLMQGFDDIIDRTDEAKDITRVTSGLASTAKELATGAAKLKAEATALDRSVDILKKFLDSPKLDAVAKLSEQIHHH